MNMQLRPGEVASPWKGLPELASSEVMMAVPKAQMRTWTELVSLSSRRTRAYMEIPGQVTTCTSLQDLVRAQTRFWESAFADYNRTAHAIAGIWGSVLPRPPAPVQAAPAAPRDLITFQEPAAPKARGGREAA